MREPKKLEPKLGLDMDFSEALVRFAQTDPKEVTNGIERGKERKPPEDAAPRRPARQRRGRPPSSRVTRPPSGD